MEPGATARGCVTVSDRAPGARPIPNATLLHGQPGGHPSPVEKGGIKDNRGWKGVDGMMKQAADRV